MPIFGMLEHIRGKLMGWFTARVEKAKKQTQLVISKVANKLRDDIAWARQYYMHKATDDAYEVFSRNHAINARTYIVNLSERECSCRDWQSTHIPCSHALGATLTRKEQPQSYVDEYFSIEQYRMTYALAILPIPDKIEWMPSKSRIEALLSQMILKIRTPSSLRICIIPSAGPKNNEFVRRQDMLRRYIIAVAVANPDIKAHMQECNLI
jgi:SWIM zinc finger